MAQKAEHHYDRDYYDNAYRSDSSSKWIWLSLAALAALALIVWAASTADVTSVSTTGASGSAPAEQTAPAVEATPQPAPAQNGQTNQ
jgi:hypothetical protein